MNITFEVDSVLHQYFNVFIFINRNEDIDVFERRSNVFIESLSEGLIQKINL